MTYNKRGATIALQQSKLFDVTCNIQATYVSGGAMFPAWSPTRWTCCARTGKIEIPRQFGPSERSLRAWGSGEKVISKGCWEKYFQTRTAAEHLRSKHPASVHPFSFPPNYRGRHQRQPAPGRRAAGREKVTPNTKTPDAYKRPG